MASPHQSQFFSASEFTLLQAICDQLIPEDELDMAIDNTDKRLAQNDSDEWRYDSILTGSEAYKLGLAGVNETAQSLFQQLFQQLLGNLQDEILKSIQAADISGKTWQTLPANRFFEELLVEFMQYIKSRISNRIQLTTDGYKPYLKAVDDTFEGHIDFAQLIKVYGSKEGKCNEKRYSPAECGGIIKKVIEGRPDEKHISASYIERQNLTMRMHMRRFTRLTNAFSKKLENHCHAIALHFVYYNFCKVHTTLRVTSAMELDLAK